MSRLNEAIEMFREDFKPAKPIKAISEQGLDCLTDEWQAFFREVGIASRKDGFIWTVDPSDYAWLSEIFDLDMTPVARNSFADFYMIDKAGTLYSFLPQYRQTDRVSSNAILSIAALGTKSTTDDPETLKRHKIEMKAGHRTAYDTCYCLRPIIPLGGSEEESELYVGDVKVYLELIAQATS
ncbi:hypothetical protein [Deinococcus daejeonensis]|uniref:T6SS immunity protein Tdi1 C-terminal domain-containing protein n=1 Tax=Deinococcus daejeonensis TaxID=1007098 RepID=A0ABQ2JDR3_9DEIO|nr:hypothetical protein [Deinococcus daejeonensis]GGN43232.1 hypothetical protein GCM10010842_30500 [Deinococcus daejeonensis]